MTPLVRVVVVTHGAGDLLARCLDRLGRVSWPEDRLEVVLVDNASADGSVEEARQGFPLLRVLRSERNLGYAGGNNLALRDLGDADYVALVNDDAFVESNWLEPLVTALEGDEGLGAATSKVVFAPRYFQHDLDSGLVVRGVRVSGHDAWRETFFVEGWQNPDYDPPREQPFRRTESAARLYVPASDERQVELLLGNGTAHWVRIDLAGEPFDVINNAGSVLLPGGYAADRGFLERDRGQYDKPAEVFAWSGTSALLRRSFLEDVGLFDERLFLYYEDLDLAWRGRARGWRYLYVPGSVARHSHAATSVVGSRLFDYHVERNRLLVHAKNAPAGYAVAAVAESFRVTGLHLRHDVLGRLRAGKRPRTTSLRRRAHAVSGFAWRLPGALRKRGPVLHTSELERWVGRS